MASLGHGEGELFCNKKILFTKEGGIAVAITNKTGGNSVKGTFGAGLAKCIIHFN